MGQLRFGSGFEFAIPIPPCLVNEKQRMTLHVRQTPVAVTCAVTSNSMQTVIVSEHPTAPGPGGKTMLKFSGGRLLGAFGTQTICCPFRIGTTGGVHPPDCGGCACGNVTAIGPAIPHPAE